MTLNKDFEEAAANVKRWSELSKEWPKKPSNDDLLALYGLYKQATIGDCNTSCPTAFYYNERAKWNAWNSHKGISQDEAKNIYIEEYKNQSMKFTGK